MQRDVVKLPFKFFQKLSELGAQELREREDYLKQKRDALMALKKESKTNLPPQNTEAKEELPSKEVKGEAALSVNIILDQSTLKNLISEQQALRKFCPSSIF